MENLLSVQEAAKRLGGISKWTVHAWLSQGKLRRTKVGGRTMIRESELKKVIRDGSTVKAPRKHNQNARPYLNKSWPTARRWSDVTRPSYPKRSAKPCTNGSRAKISPVQTIGLAGRRTSACDLVFKSGARSSYRGAHELPGGGLCLQFARCFPQ